MRTLPLFVLLVASLAACSKSDDLAGRCEQAVTHLAKLVPPSAQSSDRKVLLYGCKESKLTEEQLGCITRASIATHLASCDRAFKGRYPYWLSLATR